MKDTKIISIPYARHTPNKTPVTEKGRADVARGGNAAQVTAVKGVQGKTGAGEEDGWDQVFARSKMF